MKYRHVAPRDGSYTVPARGTLLPAALQSSKLVQVHSVIGTTENFLKTVSQNLSSSLSES